MARRRKPLSPQTWLFGLITTLAIIYISYQARVAVIQNFGEQQIARTQEAMQRIRQQQAEQQRQLQEQQQAQQHAKIQSQQQAAAQTRQQEREQAAEEMETMRQRIALEQQKKEAWERFYKAPKSCDVWRNDQHMVECQNAAMRAKREFEQRWAAGELSQPSA